MATSVLAASPAGASPALIDPVAPAPDAISIQVAAPSEAQHIAALLTLAFAADPPSRWIYPGGRQYLNYWPEFVVAFAGAAFEHGTAFWASDETGQQAGAALWLPPGAHADEEALISLLERSIAPQVRAAAFAMFEAMGSYHPDEPHWYLPLIGVDPRRHGRGYGSALLRHALALCDRDGAPAYLEATSSASKRLYERHGFQALGVIQIGSAPPIWPMLRRARAARGAPWA
jgi:ribosomal protein S18 acetylase RimI-like enzyme